MLIRTQNKRFIVNTDNIVYMGISAIDSSLFISCSGESELDLGYYEEKESFRILQDIQDKMLDKTYKTYQMPNEKEVYYKENKDVKN